MTSTACRLCCSSDTKSASTLDDSMVIKFLDFVPSINISNNKFSTKNVCQLCYGKVKISCDFIARIIESQKSFERQTKLGKRANPSLTPEDIIQKMRNNQGISIKKITKQDDEEEEIIVCSSPEPDNLLEEIEITEHQPEEIFEIEDDDSDDYFQPFASTSKAKSPVINKSNRLGKSQGVFIDAPINFTCAKCKNSFETFSELSEHMKERSCYVEIIKCKTCEKVFQTKKGLYSHMQTHREKIKMICDECGKEFSNPFDLDQHKDIIHGHAPNKGDFSFRCSHCQESYSTHYELLEHVREHKKEKTDAPRLCEICARICPNARSYQSHMSKHQPQKRPFVCLVCQKAFSKSYQLVQHSHIHTGVKAFSCDICGKSYAKRDSLRLHKKKEHP